MLCASMEELGWDTSTERLEPAKPKKNKKSKGKKPDAGKVEMEADPDTPAELERPRYILNVRVDEQVTRRFITISPISILAADGILGRGTRVWKARELVDGKESEEHFAIKDYWIDEDREREGEVVQSIVEAAPDDAHRAKLKKHIVDILCHGDVYREHISIVKRDGENPIVAKEMVADSTRDLKEAIRRRNRAIDLQPPKAPIASIPSQKDQVVSGIHTPVPPSSYLAASLRRGRPLPGVRTRNRLVMKQVGTCLHNEQSLRAVFSGLRDVCTGERWPSPNLEGPLKIYTIGLDMIHKYGWVHRDVSTGNIILWEGKGILTDFEYAKRIPKEGEVASAPHDGRTVRYTAIGL